mmetsp:Transcript_3514/g.9173  ORF Transcript_3514/g.9173 Transcript_3514/m.9173 type:complete len:290 (-) Transcript_3514:420-1289(-)
MREETTASSAPCSMTVPRAPVPTDRHDRHPSPHVASRASSRVAFMPPTTASTAPASTASSFWSSSRAVTPHTAPHPAAWRRESRGWRFMTSMTSYTAAAWFLPMARRRCIWRERLAQSWGDSRMDLTTSQASFSTPLEISRDMILGRPNPLPEPLGATQPYSRSASAGDCGASAPKAAPADCARSDINTGTASSPSADDGMALRSDNSCTDWDARNAALAVFTRANSTQCLCAEFCGSLGPPRATCNLSRDAEGRMVPEETSGDIVGDEAPWEMVGGGPRVTATSATPP